MRARDPTRLAYLAAALDLAGYFSVKREERPDGRRYSARVALKQVNPVIPRLLKATFGGTVVIEKPSKPHLSPAHRWEAADRQAGQVAEVLLPYLHVTKAQAQVLLEMRRWTERREARSHIWWWLKSHPDWQHEPMLTAAEVAHRLGYKNSRSVNEALSNGVLVALPTTPNGSKPQRRFPASLVKYLGRNRRRPDATLVAKPPRLAAVYERLCAKVQKLNQQTKRPSTRRMPTNGDQRK